MGDAFGDFTSGGKPCKVDAVSPIYLNEHNGAALLHLQTKKLGKKEIHFVHLSKVHNFLRPTNEIYRDNKAFFYKGVQQIVQQKLDTLFSLCDLSSEVFNDVTEKALAYIREEFASKKLYFKRKGIYFFRPRANQFTLFNIKAAIADSFYNLSNSAFAVTINIQNQCPSSPFNQQEDVLEDFFAGTRQFLNHNKFILLSFLG